MLSSPPKTAKDFLARIASLRADAEAEGLGTIVVYLPSLKKDLEAKGVSFEEVVSTACHG
jgi:hypothetical protein